MLLLGAQMFLVIGPLAVCAQDKAGANSQWEFAHPSMWRIRDGVLYANVNARADTRALANAKPVADVLIHTEIRFSKDSPRHNFGFVLRADGKPDLSSVLEAFVHESRVELLTPPRRLTTGDRKPTPRGVEERVDKK